MHIKLIELWNFKSFARKTRIPFYNDFTTIAGPNGSGKSNIIDAILFCLGLSTSHTLRAENLADFIYSHNGKQTDFAQVSVVLDNSAREAPMDADEVKVTRRVKRNRSEGGEDTLYSTYYLNDKVVTLTRIHDLLAPANIRPGTFNVVLQGDVTQITKMNDRERREVIDRVSGTAEFDEKTEQAARELDAVQARIEPQLVFLADSEKRLDRLEDQRRVAMEHERLTAELSRWEGYTLLAELRQREEELAVTLREKERHQKLRERLTARMEKEKAALDGMREEQRDLQQLIDRKGEEEQNAVRSELMELESGIRSAEQVVEFSRAEAAEAEAGLRSLQRREAEGLEGLALLQRELAAQEAEARQAQERLDACQRRLEEIRGRMGSADQEESGLRAQLEQAGAQLEQARVQRGEAALALDRAQDGLRRAQEALDAKRAQATVLSEEASALEAKLREDQQALSSSEAKAGALASRHSGLQSASAQARAELARLDGELDALRQHAARSRFLVSSAREEGQLPRAVEAVLGAAASGEVSGVLGTVAKLGRADPRYALALEVAAGGRMQCIVVEGDEDGERGIEYLKRVGAGVATFLPLAKMRGRQGLPDVSKEKGVAGWAIDLVEFEPRFEPAFWYVFSDTLVVDDMKTARRLLGHHRMVTLEGDLVERSGAMTGGARGKSRWRFASQEEDRLAGLEAELAEAQARRDGLRTRLAQVEAELEAAEGELSEVGGWAENLRMRLQERQAQLGRLQAQGAQALREASALEADAGERQAQALAAQEDIAAWERAVQGAQALAAQLAEALKGTAYDVLSQQLEQARTEEGEAQRQLDRARAQAELLSGKVEMARAELASIASQQGDVAAKKARLEEAIAARMAKMRTDSEAVEEYRRQEARLDGELTQLRRQREELNRGEQGVEDALRELEGQRSNAITMLNQLEYRQEEQAGVVNGLRDQVAARGVSVEGEAPTPKQVEREVQRLTKELARLGPINQLAMREYEEEASHRDEIAAKVEVLTRERSEILERIGRYGAQKRQVFMETFDAINQNFQHVYGELAGGRGEMALENPDDPFSGGLIIRAQPGGKQVKHINLLSGGEKGLVAVAMVFAIQRWKPSPFYVLDEIDMNLDEANIELVAQLIKRSSNMAQFIVITLNTPMIKASRRVLGVVNPDDRESRITGVEVPA